MIHRHLREGLLSPGDTRDLASRFSEHVEQGLWNLVPVTEALLRRTSALMISAPLDLFLRPADELGEHEVWTNDRYMLAAAPSFGLAGRSV